MKVLIVEDEQELLNSMLVYLRDIGMECRQAQNLQDAIREIESASFDCIVLDIGLPDGSGLRVIEEMQKKEHQTSILIVSARNSLDDRLTGLNIGRTITSPNRSICRNWVPVSNRCSVVVPRRGVGN